MHTAIHIRRDRVVLAPTGTRPKAGGRVAAVVAQGVSRPVARMICAQLVVLDGNHTVLKVVSPVV